MKKALITGITGQDGSYLAELLLNKGYNVHGIKRRSSLMNTDRIDHLLFDKSIADRFHLHYGDLTDSSNIIRIMNQVQPDEIYNLGAQSHVAVSFESPEYTADVDALGPLRILEAIRLLGMENKTKFYQASSSEMFAPSLSALSEESKLSPRSPYAEAKLQIHEKLQLLKGIGNINYSSGIMFNHESEFRGDQYLVMKIINFALKVKTHKKEVLKIGSLDLIRDWSYAKDVASAIYEINSKNMSEQH